MRVKFIFYSILFLAVACNQNNAANTENTDFNALKNVLTKQVEAWNNADIDGFMQGYWHSDSLRFISKRGINYGYDSVSAQYKRSYANPEKMGKLSFSNLKYTSLDNAQLANVTGIWKIEGVSPAEGYFSLICKRMDGNWKIIIDHTW
ncbi:MAG: nuclear transport factor 2 family protein [Bacteroidia bacterium]